MSERLRALIERAMLAAQCINEGTAEEQHEQRLSVWQTAFHDVIERCADLAEDFAVIEMGDISPGAQAICDGIREGLLEEFAVLV